MGSGRYVAISLEPTELRYVTSDGKKVTGWGTEPLEPGVVTDGLITDPQLMSTMLAEFLKSKKLGGKRIVSSVAGIRSLPRILRLPKLPPKLVGEAIVHEAERQMPLPMSEMYVAHSYLEDRDDDSHYFVAVCSGGVWKTTNAGITYAPVFDKQGSYSIGCVTMDPHNPNVVWVDGEVADATGHQRRADRAKLEAGEGGRGHGLVA